MKKLILICSIFILSIKADAQWIQTYNNWGDDVSKQVVADNYGNVYITGYSVGDYYDYATIKYTNGVQQWVARYDQNYTSTDDRSYAVAIDGNGNVYVTGTAEKIAESWVYDILTIKYNSSGVQQWATRYTSSMCNVGISIAVDGSGNVYVSGYTGPQSCIGCNIITIKYDPSGTELWHTIYPIISYAKQMVIDPSGNVYVTGESYNGNDFDYVTIKYNTYGVQQWFENYAGTAGLEDVANSLTITEPFGAVYVTGSSQEAVPGGPAYSITTIEYDPSGSQIWVNKYYPTYDSYEAAGLSIALYRTVCGGDGGDYPCWVWYPYVTGYGSFTNSSKDIITIKYNPNGSIYNAVSHDGSVSGDDEGKCIAVDDYGNAYVTGYITGDNNYRDYFTMKYDPELNTPPLWSDKRNGSANGNNESNWIVLDNSGYVYTTGFMFDYDGQTNNNDYATIAYKQVWDSDLSNGPLSISNDLNDITMVSKDNYYIVGDGGLILQTTNGGSSWNAQQSNTTNNLKKVFFVNSSRGIAIGDSGTVLTTTNGGVNWVSRSINSNANLHNLSIINSNTAYIVGANGKIFQTTNGGNSWISYNTGFANALKGVSFKDINHGIIVGEQGKVLRTNNGGNNWTVLTAFTTKNLNSAVIIDSLEMLAAGDNGVIYFTHDAGSTWIDKSFNTSNNLRDIYFTDENKGYIVGEGGLIIGTGDRGYSWHSQYVNSTNNINSISCYNINDGIAVGKNGTILHRKVLIPTGNGNYALSINNGKIGVNPTKFQLSQNYPNPFNPKTLINYSVGSNGNSPVNVKLVVYDITGREVTTLVNETKQPGNYKVTFDGSSYASGVYIYRIEAGSFVEVKKMVLVK
jgi:photosystem II stability/assembly factor-like uncharacterized protein